MSEDIGAEAPVENPITEEDTLDTANPEYKPPAPKALTEIISADQEDESLQRYKQQLLGNAAAGGATGVVVYPDDKRNVIVQKLW